MTSCAGPSPSWCAASKAELTTDEDEPAEAIVYCPDCAEREFGE